MKNVMHLSPTRAVALCLGLVSIAWAGCDSGFEYVPSGRPNGKVSMPIVDYLKTRPDMFTSTVAAVSRAGMEATVNSGTITFFAPSEDAWKVYLTANKYASIDAVPVQALKDLVQYHMLPEKKLSTDLTTETRQYPTTLPGKLVSLRINDNFVVFANNNQVRTSNIEPTNGAIHVLNRVLVIPK